MPLKRDMLKIFKISRLLTHIDFVTSQVTRFISCLSESGSALPSYGKRQENQEKILILFVER